jgi:hypothetical protein
MRRGESVTDVEITHGDGFGFCRIGQGGQKEAATGGIGS